MKVFDAHMHLRVADVNGINEIIDFLIFHPEYEIVLILNSHEEYDAIKANYNKFLSVTSRINFAINLNPKDLFIINAMDFFQRVGKIPLVKVHPRLNNMKKSQMKLYMQLLRNMEFKTIIVDNFVYGSTVADFTVEFINCLASEYKDRNIVMAHSGGCDLLHDLMVTKDKKNIWYEISMTCTYLFYSSVQFDLIQLIKFHSKRVIFGSDFPDCNTEQALKRTEELMCRAELSKEQKEDILYNNAVNVYKPEGKL